MAGRDVLRPLQIRRKINVNKPIEQDAILRFEANNHCSRSIDISRREGNSTELKRARSKSNSGGVSGDVLSNDDEERISSDGWIGIGYIRAAHCNISNGERGRDGV